jgi:hypothetical protein
MMSEDQTPRGAADRARINIHETYELQNWADRLSVSPERLKDAVAKVGPVAGHVATYLQKEF